MNLGEETRVSLQTGPYCRENVFFPVGTLKEREGEVKFGLRQLVHKFHPNNSSQDLIYLFILFIYLFITTLFVIINTKRLPSGRN